ncbi:NADH dehydrogenase [ubiquinone] 1 beta subcomplex subunit 7, partial [Linum grandiflorum]
ARRKRKRKKKVTERGQLINILRRLDWRANSTQLQTMEVPGSSKPMIATQAEMVEARVPMAYRDQCAHLLIPLNKCRQSEFYLPWKCENERHSYEKCEYELVMERMLQMQKIRQEEAKLKHPGAAAIGLIPKTANA